MAFPGSLQIQHQARDWPFVRDAEGQIDESATRKDVEKALGHGASEEQLEVVDIAAHVASP